MLKQIKKRREVEVEELVDIICNCCGKTCERGTDSTMNMRNYECAVMSASWGYFSSNPCRDMQCHEAHICQPCYEKMIANWVISPDMEDADGEEDE